MFAVSVMLCFLQQPSDALRSQEAAVSTAVTMNRHPVPVVYGAPDAGPHPAVQRARVRRFEDRFNRLVKAVEEFSLAYNGSKGQTWPSDKVAALRKAMLELQKADPALHPDATASARRKP